MNILVEGIDCSGKSTLVKEIKNRLGLDSLAMGHKPGDQFTRFLRAYANADGVVIERGHASELVYSQLYGRSQSLTDEQTLVLDKILELRFVVIHALPNLEAAVNRYNRRKGVYQPTAVTQLSEGRRLFSSFYDKRHVDYVYESKNYDELEELLSKLSKRMKT